MLPSLLEIKGKLSCLPSSSGVGVYILLLRAYCLVPFERSSYFFEPKVQTTIWVCFIWA